MSHENYKGLLQELCQRNDPQSLPQYSDAIYVSDNTGNNFITEVVVKYGGKVYRAEGRAKAKKEAERYAARDVLALIKADEQQRIITSTTTNTTTNINTNTNTTSNISTPTNKSFITPTNSSVSPLSSFSSSSSSSSSTSFSSASSSIPSPITPSSSSSDYYQHQNQYQHHHSQDVGDPFYLNNAFGSLNNHNGNHGHNDTMSVDKKPSYYFGGNIYGNSSRTTSSSNQGYNNARVPTATTNTPIQNHHHQHSNNNNSQSATNQSNITVNIPSDIATLTYVNSVELSLRTDNLKLQRQLESAVERIVELEKVVRDLRYNVESKHTENREYIEKQLRKKARKNDRVQPVTVIMSTGDTRKQNQLSGSGGGGSGGSGSGSCSLDGLVNSRRSTIQLQSLDSSIPSKVSFYRYLSVFSHGFHGEDYLHLGQRYHFSGFILYSPVIIPKPVIHIANSGGDHFAMSIVEYGRETLTKEEFAKLVTFHSFFYQQVLDQKSMTRSSPEQMYFVPNVMLVDNPTRPLTTTLMELITYEEPTYQPPPLKGKEFNQFFEQKFLNKVVMTPYVDFNVVRQIDYKQHFEYKDNNFPPIKDFNGNKVSLKSGVCPSLMVTHSKASISNDYWKLKSLSFYSEQGDLEDPAKWSGKLFNQMPQIKWESYIRKSKLFPKDPLVLKVFGITSLMHSTAKIAILVFLTEIEFCRKMESFKRNIYSINNERLLREVFTHPSTKRSNQTPPVNMKIYKNYKFYEGDNQRIEFLGDSVLKFCTSIYLFYKFPEAMEGVLTTKRSEMTNNNYLIEICDMFEMDEVLRLPQNKDDIKKPKADVVEALFGAVYLERGMYEAFRFIMKMIFKIDHSKFPEYKCHHQYETPLNDVQINILFANNIEIKHNCLFTEAMNCSSDPRMSYQRLEFLGDAFLDVVTSDFLFHAFPNEQEGFLSQARALLVKNDSLACIFQQLNLKDCVDLSSCPGIVFNQKRMGDLFESVVGCLLLDQGIEKTKDFVLKKLGCTVGRVLELMKTLLPVDRTKTPQSVTDTTASATATSSNQTVMHEEDDEDDKSETEPDASNLSTEEMATDKTRNTTEVDDDDDYSDEEDDDDDEEDDNQQESVVIPEVAVQESDSMDCSSLENLAN
ncbi:putative RNase III [Heterostelium album PN500]|uniref:Putative RNase III n=1 Tax=Heterostelium pallidum (strain ATCC 26659 / Pp 5 / PN500) TaxID=670386 RepID=D3AY35_HETP5|nr:putative RNase III [Heterostelium album PN500]EFA85862.1 putative RNase III [Heterostelium album PN500]|eukprot:XP_020437968.1 putative RNase III [Heterostelium album PN500]